jgi:DNA polymerase-4
MLRAAMTVPRAILHVDMDAFFASVEVRDDPRLRGKPLLVGGAGRRGVVAAASYEARKFGCRSAQPMAVALRRCPQAIVLPPRHDRYVEASRQVFEIFERYSPLVEGLSIDEAFLDMCGTERLWGPPRAAAESLRATVRGETGLTCSVGIAAVKFLAKIASGARKPDGLTEIPPGAELEFLTPLPIGELWGVGPRTQERLGRLGVRTVGDLRALGEAVLVDMFGASGRHMHQLSRGVDDRAVIPDRAAKSIGHEDTYATDVIGVDALRRCLLDQATRVADRLVASHQRARCVCLKIRDIEFVTESRQVTLPHATDDCRVLYREACRLLESVDTDGRRFRLTGVSVAALESEPPAEQLDLLARAEPPRRDAELQAVLSAVRERHGSGALYLAEAAPNRRADTTGAITHTRPNEPRRRERGS